MTPSKEPLRVSDHAVLRYMERAMGLNVEIVRQHIEELCAAPAAFGVARVRAEGVAFVITDGTVITVAPDNGSGRPNLTSQVRSMSKARAVA